MLFGEVYYLEETRDGKLWSWHTQAHDVARLKAKWPSARIFNRYGEAV